MEDMAVAIFQREWLTAHARFQQVIVAPFEGDEVQLIDMPGAGMTGKVLQVHKGTSLLSSCARTATPTILLQDQKNTRHKANRPSVLQRPGGESGAGGDQSAWYLVS